MQGGSGRWRVSARGCRASCSTSPDPTAIWTQVFLIGFGAITEACLQTARPYPRPQGGSFGFIYWDEGPVSGVFSEFCVLSWSWLGQLQFPARQTGRSKQSTVTGPRT